MDTSLLLIADIGGHTRFMHRDRVTLSHAQQRVADLPAVAIRGPRRNGWLQREWELLRFMFRALRRGPRES